MLLLHPQGRAVGALSKAFAEGAGATDAFRPQAVRLQRIWRGYHHAERIL